MRFNSISSSLSHQNHIQCQVWRGHILESQHQAYAVLMNAEGHIICQVGSASYTTCIRSAFKPFQAWSALQNQVMDQYAFTDQEIAIMCSSHNGESKHQHIVQSILQKLGYEVSDLECGAHWPYYEACKHEMIQQQHKMTALHNNCSGKHCAMLALSQSLAVNHHGYIERNHQVQQTILRYLSDWLDLENPQSIITGIDGCSLPTPQLSLQQIAHLFILLATGRTQLQASMPNPVFQRIFHAMNQQAFYVAGTDRFDTTMMESFPEQVVSKVGGEAVRGLAIRMPSGESYSVVVKVLDGAMRALHPATLCFLEYVGLIERSTLPESLASFAQPTLTNWRQKVTGSITAEIR